MTDYSELIKALTCGNDGKLPCHNNECPYWVDQWHGIGLCNVIKKDDDAADAIEALMPKRGEWIHGKELSRAYIGNCCVGIVYEDFRCSVCGVVVEECEKPKWKYCPNCGAKMEVHG